MPQVKELGASCERLQRRTGRLAKGAQKCACDLHQWHMTCSYRLSLAHQRVAVEPNVGPLYDDVSTGWDGVAAPVVRRVTGSELMALPRGVLRQLAERTAFKLPKEIVSAQVLLACMRGGKARAEARTYQHSSLNPRGLLCCR